MANELFLFVCLLLMMGYWKVGGVIISVAFHEVLCFFMSSLKNGERLSWPILTRQWIQVSIPLTVKRRCVLVFSVELNRHCVYIDLQQQAHNIKYTSKHPLKRQGKKTYFPIWKTKSLIGNFFKKKSVIFIIILELCVWTHKFMVFLKLF